MNMVDLAHVLPPQPLATSLLGASLLPPPAPLAVCSPRRDLAVCPSPPTRDVGRLWLLIPRAPRRTAHPTNMTDDNHATDGEHDRWRARRLASRTNGWRAAQTASRTVELLASRISEHHGRPVSRKRGQRAQTAASEHKPRPASRKRSQRAPRTASEHERSPASTADGQRARNAASEHRGRRMGPYVEQRREGVGPGGEQEGARVECERGASNTTTSWRARTTASNAEGELGPWPAMRTASDDDGQPAKTDSSQRVRRMASEQTQNTASERDGRPASTKEGQDGRPPRTDNNQRGRQPATYGDHDRPDGDGRWGQRTARSVIHKPTAESTPSRPPRRAETVASASAAPRASNPALFTCVRLQPQARAPPPPPSTAPYPSAPTPPPPTASSALNDITRSPTCDLQPLPPPPTVRANRVPLNTLWITTGGDQ
ncbi:hypothetical protein BJ912DRAFT_1053343 [Pholiota molesta]|nr:hypothetical protein BJ912DRAFT_1053343 [Pholiota molesta]